MRWAVAVCAVSVVACGTQPPPEKCAAKECANEPKPPRCTLPELDSGPPELEWLEEESPEEVPEKKP